MRRKPGKLRACDACKSFVASGALLQLCALYGRHLASQQQAAAVHLETLCAEDGPKLIQIGADGGMPAKFDKHEGCSFLQQLFPGVSC